MTKKTLLIWVVLLFFGFASMPDIGLSKESKQTGKTELTKKKKSGKKHGKRHRSNKRKKGSKNKRSAGKTKYSKKKKNSKHSKYSKRKKRGHRKHYARRYSAPTNNGTVEYRNYKRNSEGQNSQENIEKIAPQKEIRKEPKKEGE